MKIKLESTGWPDFCQYRDNQDQLPELNDPLLSDQQRQYVRSVAESIKEYLDEVKELYGIELDPAKIKKNEGLRYVSKLCLNSLWG